MSDLQELITELKEHEASDVAEALQEHASDHYQHIFQKGFSTAHNDAKEDKEALNARIQTLEDEVEEKVKALKEAKEEGASDSELQERINELETSNQQLKAAKEEAEKEAANAAKSYHADSLQERIVTKLIEKNVEPDYAREVLAPRVRRRIDVTQAGENGEQAFQARFMDEDGVTPLQTTDDNLADVAASKLKSGVEEKWIASNADSGGGSQGGSQGSGSGKWDQLREEAKSRQEKNSTTSSKERLERQFGPTT